MKRIAVLISGLLVCGLSVGAEPSLSAKLTRSDGRAWRVTLVHCDSEQLTYQLEKESSPRVLPLAEVESLEIKFPQLDLQDLQAQLLAADYAGVVSVLEPAVAAIGPYMKVPNNAVTAFALLTKAWLRNGDLPQARAGAEQLLAVPDADLARMSRAVIAQAALELGELDAAKGMIAQLDDPVAELYLTARTQRVEGQSKEAMQTAIELIATYPNDHNWMPQTEYLCAQLYMDLGMPDSAAEVARQVEVLYPGSEFKVEAKALQKKIEQLTKSSEQAE